MITKKVIGCILSLAIASRAFAVFGVGDVVFVAGNTDPGEIAHRAAQLGQLAQQVMQATEMVRQANTIVRFAGDPKAAVRNLGDLARISDSLANIIGVENGTTSGLREFSATARAGQQLNNSINQLQTAFVGLEREITVFGQKRSNSPDLYQALYAAERIAAAAREQIRKETEARKRIDDEMRTTYEQLRNASTESEKQALAAKISALEARHGVMTAQRQALLADMELEERQQQTAERARLIQREAAEKAEGDVMLARARQRQQESNTRLQSSLSQVPADQATRFNYDRVSSAWGVPSN